MKKAIEEYVEAIDLRDNDYKSYFKIAQLLKDLGKDAEAIEMLNNLLKNKINATLPYYKRKLDSKDDQKSINLGIKWAKTQKK